MYDYDGEPTRFERRMARRERRAARWASQPVSSFSTPNKDPIDLESGPPQNNYAAYQAGRQSEGLARLRVYMLTSTLTLLLICALLTVIWYFSGAGYFWPGWIIAFWIFAVIIQLSNYFIRRTVR